jgi:hypothetical protein
MENQPKEMKLNIRGNDATLGGTYANNMMVHMTREEFVLDFLNVIPPHATLNARVIVAPAHLKRMLKVLSNTLERYEKEFGELPEAAPMPTPRESVQ